MPCYRPLRGWRSAEPNVNGKYPIVFRTSERNCDILQAMDLPCGQCTGCRLERAREWAVRCTHEAKAHERNCFVTLTFNNDALKKRGHSSVLPRDLQLFMKRVRKRYGRDKRFMACGEYGDAFGRPHYHALLFGIDFDDKKYWKTSKAKERIYRSATLEKLWSDPVTGSSYGHSSVGALTYKSAAYVAGYVLKKQVGPLVTNGVYSMSVADLDYRTGRITARRSEFAQQSNGVGLEWFWRYYRDWYREDCLVCDGQKQGIPSYYDRKFAEKFPEEMEAIARKRRLRAREHKEDNTSRRLKVRETVRDARVSSLFQRNVGL